MSNINEIIRGLYISTYNAAIDYETINNLNIKTIINCTPKNTKLNNISYLQIPINDPPSQNDIDYVNANYLFISQLIDNQLANGNVLVHCVNGSQRSATIITIYLMVKYGLTYQNAITYVKSKRSICFFGNVNYMKSLMYVQNQLNLMNK